MLKICTERVRAFDVITIIEDCLGQEIVIKIAREKGVAVDDVNDKMFCSYLEGNDIKEDKGGFIGLIYLFCFQVVKLKECIREANYGGIDICLSYLDSLLFLQPRTYYSKIRCWEVLRKKCYGSAGCKNLLRVLAECSLLQNKNDLYCEGVDAKLEELNRILKRIVNKASGDEWERKAILFEDLRMIREKCFAVFGVKEDKRAGRTAIGRVVDTVILRHFLRTKFEEIDNTCWKCKGSSGTSSKSLLLELNKRMKVFGKSFLDGLIEKKPVKVSEKDIPTITFSSNLRFLDDVDDAEYVPENNYDEEDGEGVNYGGIGELLNEEKEDTKDFDHEIDESMRIFLKSGHCHRIALLKEKCVCGKRLLDAHGVGRCSLLACRKFFQDETCGIIWTVDNGENRMYCSECCLSNAEVSMICHCSQKFVSLSEIDLCDCCTMQFLHKMCGKRILVESKTSSIIYENACPRCFQKCISNNKVTELHRKSDEEEGEDMEDE